jgi:hypothetical protein
MRHRSVGGWGDVVEQCEADLFLGELVGPRRPLVRPSSGADEEAPRDTPGSMIVRSSRASPGFYRMPRMAGHYFARPLVRTWGQLALILFLVRLSARWAVKFPARPFGLGDLAHEDGRSMTDHQSHSTGVGVDLYVINERGLQRGWNEGPTNVTQLGRSGYDAGLTKELALLVKEVVESGFPTIQVLFNDTTVQAAVGSVAGSSTPLIKTDRERCGPPFPRATCGVQHDDHIHVLLRGTHPHSAEHVRALLALSWSME